MEAGEDVLLLELHFLAKNGVGNFNQQNGAAGDAVGATAVGGVLADDVLPVVGDDVFDFVGADFVAFLKDLDEAAEGEGGTRAGATAIGRQAAEGGDEIAGFAGEMHGGIRAG